MLFRQRIFIAQENLKLIWERNFSIGKHLKSILENIIVANGSCQIYTPSPTAPAKYFLGLFQKKIGRLPLWWSINFFFNRGIVPVEKIVQVLSTIVILATARHENIFLSVRVKRLLKFSYFQHALIL